MTVASMAAGQDTDSIRSPGAAVALDQVSSSQSTLDRQLGTSRTSDLNISAPPPISRAASVTAVELSDRADGRRVTVAPVVGDDRCDAAMSHGHLNLCKRRIESRVDQYARPAAAPVTAEGRLLLLVAPNPGGAANDNTGRSLGAVSGLNASKGPAEQVAAALQDQKSEQDSSSVGVPAKGADRTSTPSNVPTIAIIQVK